MYALEEEPESGSRWRNLLIGAGIAAVLITLVGYGAQRYEPTRKLIQRVVQMTVLPPPPKKEALPPPRTEPPPPPPKRPPPQQKAAAKTAPAPPQPNMPTPPSSEPTVGLDSASFGSGDGASFQVGNTQMGEPTNIARGPAVAPPQPEVRAPQRFVPAGVPAVAERCRYGSRARRLGLEGLMIIEVEVDERGRVTRADLRKSLDEELDRECLAGVRAAVFQPATLGGSAVASTRFLRLRFELER